MQHIRVNDYDMSYIEAGRGAPLVLVHGSLGDYRYWGRQIYPLSRVYRVVAVSLRRCYPERWNGVGSGYTGEQHIADVGAFIAALDAGPVHLLGHSRGGYVGFFVARQFPSRIRSLTLADPGGELDENASPAANTLSIALRECGELIKRGDVEDGLVRFSDVVNGPGTWEKIPEVGKMMMRVNVYTLIGEIADRRERYSQSAIQDIKAPTLLINGERSPALFQRIAETMLKNLSDGRRVVIQGAGHSMSVEQPEAFNKAVLEFLATH